MSWLVTDSISIDGLLTVFIFLTAVPGFLCLAALIGYVWECVRARESEVGKAGKSAPRVLDERPLGSSLIGV